LQISNQHNSRYVVNEDVDEDDNNDNNDDVFDDGDNEDDDDKGNEYDYCY